MSTPSTKHMLLETAGCTLRDRMAAGAATPPKAALRLVSLTPDVCESSDTIAGSARLLCGRHPEADLPVEFTETLISSRHCEFEFELADASGLQAFVSDSRCALEPCRWLTRSGSTRLMIRAAARTGRLSRACESILEQECR